MTTISGHHNKIVTLTSGAPHVTVTGTVNARGAAGDYNGHAVSAAIYGPAGTNFDLLNKGLIVSGGTSTLDAGLVFDTPGTIGNESTISGGDGILMFGGNGAAVVNSGLIIGNYGDGILLQDAGSVQNTGLIAARETAVVIGGVGHVTNSGYIDGAAGIAAWGMGSQIYNASSGHILGTFGAGVILTDGSIKNAGSISGAVGLLLNGPGYAGNFGYLNGNVKAVDMTAGGTLVNGGSLLGPVGLYVVETTPTYVLNEKTGTFAGTTFGIEAFALEQPNVANFVITNGVISGGSVGVVLYGGALGNLEGGTLSGSVAVEGVTYRASVQNAGLIREASFTSYQLSTLKAAVFLQAGGAVTNSGTIIGYAGIKIKSAPGTITNSGTILEDGNPYDPVGTAYVDAAVDLYDGGSLTNTGQIIGNTAALVLQQNGVVTNDGTMNGQIQFFAGGSFENNGYDNAGNVTFQTAGTVENFGYMTDVGIDLQAGGLFLNDNVVKAYSSFLGSGHIVYFGFPDVVMNGGATLINDYDLLTIYAENSRDMAVSVTNGGTVINAGWISGSVYFASAASNLMVVQPGSTITGTISGGGGTLVMDGGGSIGTLSEAIGFFGGAALVTLAPFSHFSAVTIEHGAAWDLQGDITLAGTFNLINNGTLHQAATDTLVIETGLLGSGTIDTGGDLTLDGKVAKGQKIRFTATGETLNLGDVSHFSGTIENFAGGDTIIINGLEKGLLTEFALSKGVLTIASIGAIEHLTFASPKSFGAAKLQDFADVSAIGITLSAVAAASMSFVANTAAPENPPLAAHPYTAPATIISNANAITTAPSGWLDTNLLPASATVPPMVTVQA